MNKEVLIMRNSAVNSLYDVVLVDYFQEDVKFILKGVQFEDAVVMQLETQS